MVLFLNATQPHIATFYSKGHWPQEGKKTTLTDGSGKGDHRVSWAPGSDKYPMASKDPGFHTF